MGLVETCSEPYAGRSYLGIVNSSMAAMPSAFLTASCCALKSNFEPDMIESASAHLNPPAARAGFAGWRGRGKRDLMVLVTYFDGGSALDDHTASCTTESARLHMDLK